MKRKAKRKYVRKSPRLLAQAAVQKMLSDDKLTLAYLNLALETELRIKEAR